jgi:hypothetical protein
MTDRAGPKLDNTRIPVSRTANYESDRIGLCAAIFWLRSSSAFWRWQEALNLPTLRLQAMQILSRQPLIARPQARPMQMHIPQKRALSQVPLKLRHCLLNRKLLQFNLNQLTNIEKARMC